MYLAPISVSIKMLELNLFPLFSLFLKKNYFILTDSIYLVLI